MSTAADYQNRAYDLVAFQGIKAAGVALTPQALTAPPTMGNVCTGAAKLAQRFLLEFLTPLGSMPFNPSRGCSFLPALMRGELTTEVAVFTAFAYSVAEIENAMRLDARDTDPLDERFADAELIGLALLPGKLTLSIQLTTEAGDTRPVILPIPIIP